MAEILGKVTGIIEVPRGPDVSLRIMVPRLWLLEGRTIEVELPRNLTCACCQGGGCGRCKNSGAITLRGRGELPEMIQVSLPEQNHVDATNSFSDVDLAPRKARGVTIRIPECGGLPESGSDARVRGWLLLEVAVAEAASTSVRLLEEEDPLSSSRMLRAEVKREPSADASNQQSEVVMVAMGSTRSAARRTCRPSVVTDEDNSLITTVQNPTRPWLLDVLVSSTFVRGALGIVVAAIAALWMWYAL